MSSATIVMHLKKNAFSKLKRSSMPKASVISLKRNSTHSIKTHVISSFLWNDANAHVHLPILQRQPLHLLMLLMTLAILIERFPSQCHAVGYSYARFVGPVIGPEHEILVHDDINGGTHLDYVAHPEYQFSYGVEDSETQVLQNRKETRNGDEVRGVYSVVDPDGVLRVVKYTADNLNGFQAEVITNGVATIHGQNNDGIKDNNGANYHVETGHKNYDNGNNYEVHDEYDDNSEDRSKNTNDDNTYYDNNDENDDDDDDDDGESESEEFEESKSVEVNETDADSDEIDDY